MNATDQPSRSAGTKPTVVLVHDAFADGSSWNGVIERLQQPGYTVIAPAFSDVSGPPAWKKLPCWAVVATGDKAAGADITRSMARRAGAEITEVEGSHVIMISQPQAVADVIVKAAEAVGAARG